MSPYSWNEAFRTGLEGVDRHHQRLFEMVDQMEALVAEEGPFSTASLRSVVEDLVAYAGYHFEAEHQEMVQIGVDDRHVKFHRAQHAAFVRIVANTAEALEGMNRDDAQELQTFLAQWLVAHVLQVDMAMGRQVRAIRQGVSADVAYEEDRNQTEHGAVPILLAAFRNHLAALEKKQSRLRSELTRLGQKIEVVEDRAEESADELRRTLEALQKEKAICAEAGFRYKSVVETTMDGYWLVDTTGTIQEVNDAYLVQSGFERQDLIGQPISVVEAQESPEETARHIEQIMREGHAEFETIHKKKNGTLWTLAIRVTFWPHQGGRFFVFLRDITEFQNAQQALQASEEEFSSAFHFAAIGKAILSPDGRWLRVNQALCTMLGYSEAELLTKTFQDLTHPDDLDDDLIFVEEMLAGRRQTYQMEKRYFHRQGQIIWGLLSVSLVRDGQGQPKHFISQIQDITKRKTAELALQEKDERLRQVNEELQQALEKAKQSAFELEIIMDAFPGLVFYKDTQNNFMRVNKFFADAHRTDKSHLEGKSCFELYPQPEAQAYWDDDLEVLNHGKSKVNIVEQWKTETGHRWVLTTKVPFVQEGEAKGVIGVSIDITEQKAIEERLNEVNADLNRANTDLEQFAYVASHDLRAPLRAIESLSQWLEEDLAGSLTPENQTNLILLRSRAKRMEGLLDGILHYSRAGRGNLAFEDVKLDDLVQELVGQSGIERKVVALVSESISIHTVSVPFRQVIQNLIVNAIKHHDGPEVHVAVGVEDGGDRWEFSVSDDGPGIPEAFHDKVFTIFQTLKPRDEVEGSGIGLSIVKKLVNRYGGNIWVEANAPRGATFRFTWPKSIHFADGGEA